MESSQTFVLYKERSYAACISDGFKFFFKNLKLFALRLLPYLFIISLITLRMNILSYKMQMLQITHSDGLIMLVCEYILILLLMFALIIMANAQLFCIFREKMNIEPIFVKAMIKRSLPYIIGAFVIYCILSLIVVGIAIWLPKVLKISEALTMVIAFIGIIAMLIVLSPIYYSYYHHLLSKDATKLNQLKTTFLQGGRYIWKIVGVGLLGIFITSVISMILQLPQIILGQAYVRSLNDAMIGDIVNLPTSSFLNVSLLSCVCYALSLFLSLPNSTILLFLYGDIYTRTNTATA